MHGGRRMGWQGSTDAGCGRPFVCGGLVGTGSGLSWRGHTGFRGQPSLSGHPESGGGSWRLVNQSNRGPDRIRAIPWRKLRQESMDATDRDSARLRLPSPHARALGVL